MASSPTRSAPPPYSPLRAGHRGSELPPWLVPLLRCLRCGAEGLDPIPARSRLGCPGCGRGFEVDRGVGRFLDDPHPAVRDERRAVAELDAGRATLALDPGIRHRLRGSDPETEPLSASGLPSGEGDERSRAFLRHVAESREQLRQVLTAAPLHPGEHVVELGADNCWASSLFLDAGCRVTAIDITEHLWLAETADAPGLARLEADMNRLPLADACADVVWATAAAHHSWDLGRTFREAARVLRPGGRLAFCCEPMPSWLRWPFGLGAADEERALGIHETWIPRRRWLALAREAGFAARIVYPELEAAEIRLRLEGRGLPRPLASPTARWIRPLLPWLQVSAHLLGTLEPPKAPPPHRGAR